MVSHASHNSGPLPHHVSLYTDLYELTMAQGYFLAGKAEEQACFDYFFRALPFDGGYVIFAGLADLVEMLQAMRFDADDREYLRSLGFKEPFLRYLEGFRFTAELLAPLEGDLVFPYEPVVRVCGNLIEAQVVETLVLNVLNFQSLIATKASRMRQVAPDKQLIDFGLRRAQGLGGIHASRAAVVGGFDATSNVYAAYRYGLDAAGTQAHSWITSFGDELTAFRTYAEHFPDKCVLLVDTYDTLRSGVPNAVIVGKELQRRGHRLMGIRMDSGDLAYLAKKARAQLDEAGLQEVQIVASSQLDEHVISSLLQQQGAPIDAFGVGTQLVTAFDDPALDGVYKMSQINDLPRLKISENYKKVNFPGKKHVLRLIDDEGLYYGDAVALEAQGIVREIHHPFEPMKRVEVEAMTQEIMLRRVMAHGEVVVALAAAQTSRTHARRCLERLPVEHKRFANPHIYKVGLSTEMLNLRDRVLAKAREEIQIP